MSEPSSGDFFAAWRTYQKVVAGNCMFHREIGEELRRTLRERFGGEAFSMLDLGCGDAATLAPVLEGLALERYKGVDLSRTALELAARNLVHLPCSVELVRADLASAVAEEADCYDLVYSSFAVHHLATGGKAKFFRHAAQRLKTSGLMLLVDVVREDDESLEVYLSRYCAWLRESWTPLAPHEREAVCDHLVSNDLPEPWPVLEEQARAAGFGQASVVARHNWHRLMRFARGRA